MARYSYQVRDGRGDLQSGVMMAATLEAAGAQLRAEGKFIVKLAESSDRVEDDGPVMSLDKRAKRVKRADVIFFAHQMAVMIETGVSLTEALECIADQAANPHFRVVIADVASQVQQGSQFSAALKRYPKTFPPVMITLLRASEESGTMGVMLDRISKYLAKERKIVRQARGALAYPIFMLCTAVAVTIFLLTFVMPNFAAIFEKRGAALPGPTRFLMGLSEGLTAYWWAWAPALGVGLIALLIARQTKSGERAMDWLKLNLPIAKHLYTHLYVTRACSTMGTMISAGVPMLDTVKVVRRVTHNSYFRDLFDEVDQSVRQGKQLTDPLFESTLIPRSIVQMLRAGEKSGRLGEVLAKVAAFSEEEFDESVKTTAQFVEPVMLILMGTMIGFVAIALLLPVFKASTVVGG